MWEAIRRGFAGPEFDDATLTRRAQILSQALLVIALGSAVLLLLSALTKAQPPAVLGAYAVLVALLLWLRRQVGKGRVDAAARGTLIALFLGVGSAVVIDGFDSPALISTVTLVFFAGAVQGGRGALTMAVAEGFVIATVFGLQVSGIYVPDPPPYAAAHHALIVGANLLIGALLLTFLMRALETALTRVELSNRAMNAVLDHLPDGVGFLSEEGVLIWLNPTLARMAGSRDALLGHRLEDSALFDEPSKTRVGEAFADALEGKPSRLSLDVVRPGGDERRYLVQLIRSSFAGETGVQVIVRDDTERWRTGQQREQLEAGLRSAQKLESLGRLAGGVAHDFNNLLTVIIGNLEAIEGRNDSSTRDIRDAAQQAAELTRQLLMFSRQERDEPRQVDVVESVKTVTRMLRRLLPEGVALDLQLPDAACYTWMDPGQLAQVLINLAVNAGDAMREAGGTLTIHVQEDEHQVHLRVSDTGTGIPDAELDAVFEPFFTTKAAGKGTGLGLSVVHGIVMAAGGTIFLESSEGRGTRVHIRLPATKGLVGTGGPADTPALRGAGERILVIEDEAGVRTVVCDLLRSAGFEPVPAANGTEAHDKIGTLEIHAVLSDVQLAGETGPEVVASLREIDASLRVLYMSGYPGAQLPNIAEEDLLLKPFRRDMLAAALRAVLDRD